MSAESDVRHTLACCRREQAAERATIARLNAALADAHHRLDRAIRGELACRDKLKEIRR